jgi:hypothetical protein
VQVPLVVDLLSYLPKSMGSQVDSSAWILDFSNSTGLQGISGTSECGFFEMKLANRGK